MKILIIGGTKFLGRHLVAAAQAREFEVTLFHRGNHSSEGIENVEEIFGDRNDDLDKLKNRNWDACVDTCGYLPQTVKASAQALKDLVNQYVFISSISANADFTDADYDETLPLATLNEEQSIKANKINPRGEITAVALEDMYGALKALCEREAQKVFGDKTLIVRSGLIVGAFDTTDRFTYWVMRVAGGDEVLAPGKPNRFVQFIDARDLAEWIIKMIEDGQSGIYNATGKPFEITMEKMLEEIKIISQSDAKFTWVDEDFLKRETVAEWSEMPLYLAESVKEAQGFLSANIDKALQTGLKFRSLSDTIKDTLDWRKMSGGDMKAGIDFNREQELLRKWHEQ
ncbi:MAG: NAD-dependent epimerase/dehydratase family protein [Acidobacteriota bacterium]|nr:NAD-dependent epimerase/dehydratase family protein [Acidobacteriota bacterium]